MKKRNFLWSMLIIGVTAMLSAGITSCTKDNHDPELKVSTRTVTFDSKGNGDGNVYVSVENTGWTASITEGAEHFSLSPTSGKESATITISTRGENTSSQDYKATVLVSSTLGKITESINVTQDKPSITPISVSPTSVSMLGAKGSTNTITIKTDVKWWLEG